MKFEPVARLNQASASTAMTGTAWANSTSWLTKRAPNAATNPRRARPATIMTTPVARPRFIRVASFATAGSIASAMNHAMTT